MKDNKDRILAILSHVSGLVGCYIIPAVGGILFPLLIWGLGKTPERILLQDHGKEAINFQISIIMYFILGMAMAFCLSIGLAIKIGDIETFIVPFAALGAILIIGLVFFEVIFVIKASIKASKEENYRYPLTIRLIK